MTDPTATPPEPSDAPAPSPVPAPPPATPPAPAAPPPAPATASPGAVKVRQPVAVILLSIVTLGIYFFYWTYQVFRELKETTREGIGPIIGLLIVFVFSPINWFVLPSEIGNMYAHQGKEKPVSGATGFWNFLPLIGWIIWIVKVQGALNRQWESTGA
jgi:hypothetical protein